MAYDDTGKHNHLIGKLNEAERAFNKEREFCQTPSHIAIMMFRLIGVFIDRRAWISVESTASKVRDMIRDTLRETSDVHELEGILATVTGLAQMSSKNYAAAAASFLDTNVAFMSKTTFFGDSHESSAMLHGVLTASDVATYGALCALASMDRAQLQRRVLDNAGFRQFLEREPHLRRAISFFVGGKFAQCLTLLEQYRADYLLDVNLYPHVVDMLDSVRRKAVVQFLEPYSRVTFRALALAFNLAEDAVVALRGDLVQTNALRCRLDLAGRTVPRRKTDLRRAAQAVAVETAKAFEATLQQRSLRLEAVLAGLEVKAPAAQDGSADTLMGAESIKGLNVRRRGNLVA